MLISPAYAQAPGGGSDMLLSLMPFILIFVIMYFLIIRPQRQRMKAHQQMVAAVKRGDTVVTSGGLIAKVTKVVDDAELEVELAQGVKVRVVRGTISEVRARGEPAVEKA